MHFMVEFCIANGKFVLKVHIFGQITKTLVINLILNTKFYSCKNNSHFTHLLMPKAYHKL